MIRSRFITAFAGLLVTSTFSTIAVIPPASAATQTITYLCTNATRNITLDVNPGDVLNVTSNCGAVFLQAFNSGVISSNSGSGFPSRSFVVSASLAPGTYTDAIEVYAAAHHFYQLVYTAAVTASPAEIAAAAAVAAAQKRDAEQRAARSLLVLDFKEFKPATIAKFVEAGINGITSSNITAVNAEIALLPETSRTNISEVLKIARKYEVVGTIASEQVNQVIPKSYVEIGLISADSKNKTELVAAVRRLNSEDRNSYAAIKSAIEAERLRIQMRADHLAAVKARSSNGK